MVDFPPQASATPASPNCLKKAGQIEQKSLQTKQLPDPLDFRVYLPPCYTKQPAQPYPVLYLIHGQSFNDDQWVRLGATTWADQKIAAGEVSPFMIVMPRDRNWGQPDEDSFGDVIIQELIPYIDATYPTLADRQHRRIGGLSRGGGWSVHLGLSRWDLFDTFGGHSLAIFWTDSYVIEKWLDAIPAGQMPRIFMDIGDQDTPQIAESATWLEDLLTRRGITHEWHIYQGYHDEKYWGGHLDQYMLFYTEGW